VGTPIPRFARHVHELGSDSELQVAELSYSQAELRTDVIFRFRIDVILLPRFLLQFRNGLQQIHSHLGRIRVVQYDHGHLARLQLPSRQQAGVACNDASIGIQPEWAS
jgi:hypothetical protein